MIRSALVTGAAGFVGGALCSALQDKGVEVVAHCRPRSSIKIPQMRLIQSDLTDPTSLDNVPDVDIVFHCAAQRPKGYDDREAAQNNRLADDTVLAVTRRRRKNLVYASMATLFGLGNSCPPGSALGTTAGIYPLEKARTEDIGLKQAKENGTLFSALRINAPYGPKQAARTVIQIFIDNALAKQPLRYHGTGSREQDFTYGEDIAEAFIAATTKPSGYYLISGGAPISMKNLSELVCEVVEVPKELAKPSGHPDPQEGFKANFDISETSSRLDWRPRTSLSEGLRACLDTRKLEIEKNRGI